MHIRLIKLSIAVAAIVIAGCATTINDWSTIDAGPKPDYETSKAQAEEVLKDVMFDPDSAKFRNWTPLFKTLYNYGPGSTPEGLWALCVDVNGKNKFGGYVGYQTWYVKFRDGKPITDKGELGMGKGSYQCREAVKGRQSLIVDSQLLF